MRRNRTVEDARADIAAYEKANADLPQQTRRLMALHAVAYRHTRATLSEALGLTDEQLPRSIYRDAAWFWWNVLQLSGLERHWEGFKRKVQTESTRAAVTWLRSVSTKEEIAVLKRRYGRKLAETSHSTVGSPLRSYIWTKGGSWRVDSPFTKLLVLKQHLPDRVYYYRWQRKLGVDGVRALEQELMYKFDPDADLQVEIRKKAVEYVRRRIAEITKASSDRMSPGAAAWFFNIRVPGDWAIEYAPQPDGSVRRVNRIRSPGWRY